MKYFIPKNKFDYAFIGSDFILLTDKKEEGSSFYKKLTNVVVKENPLDIIELTGKVGEEEINMSLYNINWIEHMINQTIIHIG